MNFKDSRGYKTELGYGRRLMFGGHFLYKC